MLLLHGDMKQARGQGQRWEPSQDQKALQCVCACVRVCSVCVSVIVNELDPLVLGKF